MGVFYYAPRDYSGARKTMDVCPSRIRIDIVLWCCEHYQVQGVIFYDGGPLDSRIP